MPATTRVWYISARAAPCSAPAGAQKVDCPPILLATSDVQHPVGDSGSLTHEYRRSRATFGTRALECLLEQLPDVGAIFPVAVQAHDIALECGAKE
jgi:hypothetical protein